MKKIFLLLTMAVLCLGMADAKVKVHTIGDSTMANYDESSSDKRGWCQYLQSFFDANQVEINNRGKSGADTRQFYLTQNLWPSVKSQMSAGDYLLIQFAHNDEGTETYGTDNLELAAYNAANGLPALGDVRGTNPQTTYRDYLRLYIDEARALGVNPVLVAPICRKYFQGNTIRRNGQHDLGDKFWKIENGQLLKDQVLPASDHSMDYVEAMRIVAQEKNVPFIDLTAATRDLYLQYGEAACTADLFCAADNTHLATMGANVIGRLGAQLLQSAGILAQYINIPNELTAAPASLEMGETYAGILLQKELVITGFGLTPDAGNVTITASSNLQVSTDKVAYGQTATAAYTSGNIFQRIYVKAQYTASGAQTDNIVISDGTTTVTVPVTAAVVSLEGGTPVSATWAIADKATAANAVTVGPVEASLTMLNMMAADTKADFDEAGAPATLVRLHNSDATNAKVAWPANEIDENASRYVDFAITAPLNAEIRVTSISMKMAAYSTGTMNCHVNIGLSDNMTGVQTICEKRSMTNKNVYSETFNPTITIPAGEVMHVRVLPWHESASTASGKYIALKDVVIEGMAFETAAVEKYTVTFVNNGHGAAVASVESLHMPNPLPVLVEEGWIFDGWFTDASFETPAVAGADLTEDVTLYAKWTVRPTFTVTYDNNGHGETPAAIDVYELPASFPVLAEEGWIFGGWYTDAALETPAVKGAAVAEAITLYAKWTEVIPEAPLDTVAAWDFRDANAACVNVNLQGVTGAVLSSVAGIEMEVDATCTNGKLQGNGQYAQYNGGTILRVPTVSAQDEITVVAFPGQHFYTIDGVAAEADSVTVTAQGPGYCEIVATATAYLYCIRVKQVPSAKPVKPMKEVVLYATDFQNWDAAASATTAATKTVSTKAGDITFTWAETAIVPDGTNTKFTNTEVISVGYAMAAKTASPYIETSVIPSVTKVSYVHAATGGSRGWGLQVREEGATAWTTIFDTYCVQAGTKVEVDVNRENVQLRWYNLNGTQNAYMTELAISGNIEVAERTFKDFELNFVNVAEMPATPEGVTTLEGTPRNDAHGVNNFRLVVPVDGPVRFTIGGCQYSSTPATVLDHTGATLATIDVATPGCYHNGGVAVWTYNVEAADTLTIVGGQYTPYIKAEACDYVASVNITYFDQNDKLLGKTEVSPVEPLTFAYTEADLTIADGYAFRGWVKADGTKFEEGKAPGAELKLYALVTAIEEAVLGAHYEYDLTKPSFYMEDHECISAEGGAYYNNHGWNFNPEGKVEVAVAGKAYVQLTLCQYGNATDLVVTAKSTGDTISVIPAKVEADGGQSTIFYGGAADTLVLTFKAQTYLHAVSVYNVQDQIVKGNAGYYEVPAGDAASLLLVLMQLQKGDKVFLPNGTYDLGEIVLTQISVDSVSIIGESAEGTIIKNAPDASTESINNTATLVLTGKGTYLQDLTLQNALDYYKANNGRAVALWDKGEGTICKNVRLLSYQDTYYSNKPGQKLYWEGGEIHGTVDYICGSGTVYFNEVELYCEKRNANGGGSDCITASNAQTARGDKGYIFESCTIKSECPTVSLSRAWNDQPQVVYLNTVLDQSAGEFSFSGNGIQRWTVQGMNNCDPYVFGEYNTVDTEGNVVSPASNVVTFTSASNPTIETIFTADQAAAYSYANVLGEWNPKAETEQVKLELDGTVWNVAEGIFLIEKEGQVTITTELPATVEEGVVVRAANGRGGFGPAAVVKEASAIDNNQAISVKKYVKDGQIIIEKNGVCYGVLGERL